MVSLDSNYRGCCLEIDRLIDLQSHIGTLAPKYSKMVAEIILVRLFDIIVESFASIAVKLVCGALYVDGSNPLVILPARSKQAAIQNMTSVGRRRQRVLRWSEVDEIKKNIRYVLNISDHYIRTLDHHCLLINEMRIVRNRIAHNNKRSRENYRRVVLRHYGASLNFVSPGMLLISSRQTPTLIQRYLLNSKALIKVLLKA